jgi:hypothetical protein
MLHAPNLYFLLCASYPVVFYVGAIYGVPFAAHLNVEKRAVAVAYTMWTCLLPLFWHGAVLMYISVAVRVIFKGPDRLGGFLPGKVSEALGLLSCYSGVGKLPAVWAWQCWIDLAEKATKVVGSSPVAQPAINPVMMRLSILASVDRLFTNSWPMFQVYFLTEWLRILLLVAAACIGVSWRVSSAGQPTPDYVRASMAVLSLAVTHIKSVRDKWKLLEHGMQQFSYAGAVVLQMEHTMQRLLALQTTQAACLQCRNTFGSFAARWYVLEARLQALSPADLESSKQVVHEMVRRANKAVMSDDVKACYL